MESRKKPPSRVRSIAGTHVPDAVISQEQLTIAAELQAAVWMAEKSTRECVQEIERQMELGATVEDGDLIFDRELQMVRHKRMGHGSKLSLTPEQRLQIYEEEKTRIEGRRKEGSG